MLPRFAKVVRVLMVRQRIVGQHLLCSDHAHYSKVPYRLLSNVLINCHSYRMLLLDWNNLNRLSRSLYTKQCLYGSSKMNSADSVRGQTEKVKNKSKTTGKTGTEPKPASETLVSKGHFVVSSAPSPTSSPAASSTSATSSSTTATAPPSATSASSTPTTVKSSSFATSSAASSVAQPETLPTSTSTSTSPTSTSPSETVPAQSPTTPDCAPESKTSKETKKLEIKTSKGLLSITTTIEDSKINDVIFEKSSVKAASAAPVPAEEAKDIVKSEPKSKAMLLETKPSSMAAVLKPSEKPKSDVSEMVKSSTVAAPLEMKPKPKKRVKVDCNRSSMERNFITPARAMSDFLLKASDLESLPKIKRRSPYEQEPPITVYWRRDVEAKAIEVWGSREDLLKETLKREIERKKHQQNLFTVKRRLRDYRREIGARTLLYEDAGLKGKSGKVVLIAIGINGLNFLFKVCGWLYTGSHSMFAEAIHSLADTVNQLILAYGIHKSTQMADSDHPYGYSNMKHVSSLISGVGIFCVGAGLSLYHGITGILHPEPLLDFYWAFFILGGSMVSEGATLLVAINEIRRSAKSRGISFQEYVLTGKDPCVNVVLTEDAAAVASVILAASCMGLTSVTGSPVFDAVGSLLIGGILGGVASFIIYTNVAALVGKSISEEKLNRINAELESDVMIRAIHDVKGIDMGNCLVRYKAEMDFDGRELTRSYLDKQDLNELLKVVKSFQTVEELEQFLLNHGENIVDLMGGEIDRIEMKLRKKFPEIRHCDLEIL